MSKNDNRWIPVMSVAVAHKLKTRYAERSVVPGPMRANVRRSLAENWGVLHLAFHLLQRLWTQVAADEFLETLNVHSSNNVWMKLKKFFTYHEIAGVPVAIICTGLVGALTGGVSAIVRHI